MTTPNTSSLSNTTAFLIHQDQVYFTQSNSHAVGTLLESVWSSYPNTARSITRNRIYSFDPLTPLCDGMLKVVGKRSTQVSKSDFYLLLDKAPKVKPAVEPILSIVLRDLPLQLSAAPLSENEAMNIAIKLSSKSTLGIAAVLLDENLKLVSWGWNDHFHNRTLHAEVMLVHHYWSTFKKKIPPNYTLVTTLQPCAMCAGYLYEYCENFATLKIVYRDVDPGPFAQNSILIPGSSLWTRFKDQSPLN